jgi:hypothetical protein
MAVATASPMGGEASPLLLPATSTPSASTKPVEAPATAAMPTTATDPAATAMRRGPGREVNASAPSTAKQYPA